MEFPTLETPRLVLRRPRPDDAEAVFFGYARDAEVCRYMTWRPNESVVQTEGFMHNILARVDEGKSFTWAITQRGDDTLIGMIELRPDGHKADFGYVLARAFWGRSLMTEALLAVLDFAFTLPGIYRVWGVCDVDNIASARVMEKSGLTYEGTLRRDTIHPNISDEPRDVRCYARVR
ncbi:MAG TPA: GNAT family N-acetyltransferase [Pyrinomonadaceae bacterium]|jgi:RimJ/RimL family protein N-acetyltransferase|nr:GNAT family N-acetyltransferase [Pyrinomonadaceae bacterium]